MVLIDEPVVVVTGLTSSAVPVSHRDQPMRGARQHHKFVWAGYTADRPAAAE